MEQAFQLFAVRQTIFEMLLDRGYRVPAKVLAETKEEFSVKYRDTNLRRDMFFLTRKTVADRPPCTLGEPIFVFFADEPKVGVKTVRGFASIMQEEGVGRALLVYKEGMTNQADQALSVLSPKIRLEPFTETELLTNVTRHKLVPSATRLSPSEKQEMLTTYQLKETQLPRMHCADPVARYYGLDKGDVVRIKRASETGGRYVSFRLVVS